MPHGILFKYSNSLQRELPNSSDIRIVSKSGSAFLGSTLHTAINRCTAIIICVICDKQHKLITVYNEQNLCKQISIVTETLHFWNNIIATVAKCQRIKLAIKTDFSWSLKQQTHKKEVDYDWYLENIGQAVWLLWARHLWSAVMLCSCLPSTGKADLDLLVAWVIWAHPPLLLTVEASAQYNTLVTLFHTHATPWYTSKCYLL